jgi:hypothetical protein
LLFSLILQQGRYFCHFPKAQGHFPNVQISTTNKTPKTLTFSTRTDTLLSRVFPPLGNISLRNSHGDPLSLSLSPQNPNPSFPPLPLFHHHHHNCIRHRLSLRYLLPLSPPPPRRCRRGTPPCLYLGYFGERVVRRARLRRPRSMTRARTGRTGHRRRRSCSMVAITSTGSSSCRQARGRPH